MASSDARRQTKASSAFPIGKVCKPLRPFVIFAGVVASVLRCSQSTAADAASPEHPTATAIYERAVDAVDALPMPPYVAFTEEDLSTGSAGLLQEQLRIVVRTSDGHAIVRRLRTYDGTPVDEPPQVVTTAIYPLTIIYRIGDFPLADFGLRRTAARPGIFEAAATPAPAATDEALRTLTKVTIRDVPYRLSDLGNAMLAGRSVYHLGLQPLRDPGHHVLRELWIDPQTSLPLRYVAERFVAMAGMPFRYLVTVDTATIDTHLVNIEADGRIDVHRALVVRYAGEGHWRVRDVAFPASVPDWAFDPNQFGAHDGESVPGL